MIKEVAREIASSKTKGFSDAWIEYREEEYRYWLKRIRKVLRHSKSILTTPEGDKK